MDKKQFYLNALKANAYLRTAWNICCFGLVAEGPDDWKENPYPYRLVQLTNGFYYVDPDNPLQLLQIDNAKAGTPLFARDELIVLQPGDLPNVVKETITTYGNTLANALLLVYPFGNKVNFLTGRISASKIEVIIEQRLVDEPHTAELTAVYEKAIEGIPPTKQPITVNEYLRYADAAFSLVGYTQLYTPADTRKTMTAPPGVVELRNKLIKENEGKLHDRTVVADIATKLQAHDAEYLKGDRALDFLISSKSRNIVRSRLFLMYGAETGIEEKVDVDLIQRSLEEGWDIEKFPEMNNALRAGSYYRGKLTELGGAAVKEIFRAAGNVAMSGQDCGSVLGLPSLFTNEDKDRAIGFTVIESDNTLTKLTEDNIDQYLGREISLRSPMTCIYNHTDYCATCIGERLSNNPTGMAMAAIDYGAAFLGIFMSAAHSKGIQTAKLDLKSVLI